MSARDVEQVLKELGWSQGATIPVADAENRLLQIQIEEMMKKKAEMIIKSEQVDDRLKAMKEMIKSVGYEQQNNEQVISALKRQIESEVTSLKLAQSHYNKVFNEINTMKKELKTMNTRDNKYKEDIERLTEKIQKLKARVEWGELTLFSWEENSTHLDRDQDILEKLKVKENETIKNLYLKLKAAREDKLEVQKIQDSVLDKILCLEGEVAQACHSIRSVNAEKSKLIENWQRLIDAVKKRDSEIDRKSLELEETKNGLKDKYQKYLDRRNTYEKDKRSNDQLELEERILKDSYQKLINSNSSMDEQISEVENEIFVNQVAMSELSSKLQLQKFASTQLGHKLSSLMAERDSLRLEISELESHLNALSVDNLTAEQKSQNADEVYKMGIKAKEKMLRELDHSQEVVSRLLAEMPSLKEDINTRLSDIYDLETIKKLTIREIENTKDTIQEKDMQLYGLEYQLAELHSKIFEAKTKNVTDIMAQWKRKISDLEEKLKQKQDNHNEIKAELHKTKEELQNAQNRVRKLEIEKENCSNRIKEMNLGNESLERALKLLQNECNQSVLKLNLMKMQINVMKQNISKQGRAVSLLEREKVCLEAAMKERKLEIDAQRELLITRKRTLNEEKTSLRKSIEHLNIRITQLQKRYEIAIDMLGKTADGEQVSVTYFKIKMGQEKYELQEEGDELEAKIIKAEQEIEAMENTLKLISNANKNFKKNLDPIESDGPEMQERNRLELEYYVAVDKYKEKKALTEQINEEIKELLTKLAALEEEEQEIHLEWKNKDNELSELEKDLAKKQMKLDRATKHMLKLQRDLSLIKDASFHFKDFAQKDINVLLKHEQNQSALQQLGELSTNYIETFPMVQRYLAEKGMVIPKNRSSLGSSRNSISMSRISLSSRSFESLGSTFRSATTRDTASELSRKGLCGD